MEPTSKPAAGESLRSTIPRFRGRVRGLDGLRGLAILLVLVLHLWRPEHGTLLGQALSRLSRLGWAGVDLFFVLSGFLITGILIDSRRRPGSIRNFFARRVLRIFPLYYLFLATTLLLMPIYAQRMHLERVPGYQYAADAAAWPWYVTYTSNLWMADREDFSPGYANSLTWSLAIEEQFYLVWPFLILLCPPKKLLGVIAAVFLGAVGLRAALAFSGGHWLSIFLLTPCRLDTLAAGGLMAAYLRSPRFRPDLWRRLSGAALFVCLPAAGAWLLLAGDQVRETPSFQVVGYSLLALGWAGLLAKVLDQGPVLAKLFEARPMASLGKYSYGIYLFHLLAFVVVYPLVYRQVLSLVRFTILERLFWLGVGIAGSWLLAAILYHAFEVRFLRLKRYFGPAPEERVEAVEPGLGRNG